MKYECQITKINGTDLVPDQDNYPSYFLSQQKALEFPIFQQDSLFHNYDVAHFQRFFFKMSKKRENQKDRERCGHELTKDRNIAFHSL